VIRFSAAPVSGYIGFAVGRTIWEDALREHVAGPLGATAASRRIAHQYRRMINAYAAAADATAAAA